MEIKGMNNMEDIYEQLYKLSEAIAKKTKDNYQGGLLGGEFGYGQDYENEVFKMHPFCWCDKDDCGYCAGIGAMPSLLREI